jgi:very-short-patch-repair endonuclease
MDNSSESSFPSALDGESVEQYLERLQRIEAEGVHRNEKNKIVLDDEERWRLNAFKNANNLGPLRRALKRIIATENSEHEFVEKDRMPYGLIFGETVDENIQTGGFTDTPGDVREAGDVALQALMQMYCYHAKVDLECTFARCQSPIEAILLGALVTVISRENYTLKLSGVGSKWPYGMIHRSHNSNASISIEPQTKIGRYTVDFMIQYRVIAIDYPPEVYKDSNSQSRFVTNGELAFYEKITRQLVVECDGHQFHEKTKEQVSRDKKRDRDLQTAGYKVFRFSGSEISNDPIACAYDVLRGFAKHTGRSEPINPPSEGK